MFDVLHSYFESRFSLTEEEFDFIKSHFILRKINKGEFLQHAGEKAKHAVFIAKGCLRMYVIDSKIKERIVQFAPETWWLSDTDSLMKGTASIYFIDAIEDSDVLLLEPSSHLELIRNIPGYAASYQTGIQMHAAAKNRQIAASLNATAEEKYLNFLETYPSISLRVPQHMLASYLGITPETLSRVRRKIAKK